MAQPSPPKYPDAYADLGVTPTASHADIKSAYRKLALLHHPDKNLTETGGAADAAEFRKANEAYEILKDDQTKAKYDRQYSEVLKDWAKYNSDVTDFSRDPEAWRGKQATAERQRPMSRPSPADYYYNDDEGFDYGFFGFPFFGFGGFGFGDFGFGGARPPQERPGDQKRKPREKKESDSRFAEYMKAEREKMLKAANLRALELQRIEAKAAQPRGDGIRTYSLEEKLAMAKKWVQGIQQKYVKELKGIKETKIHEEVQLDLGWEKIKKGRHTCNFCDAVVPGYSYRCPSGGAMACRPCKNAIDSSSLKKPFEFVNTHARFKKGKAQKKASDSDRKGSTSPIPNNVESEEDAAKLAADIAAQERASQRLEKERLAREERKGRQKSAREAGEKTAQAAAEALAHEQEEAEKAARHKVPPYETARETARQKKEAEATEPQKTKSAKKSARKKAAKEKKEQSAKFEAARLQRELDEKAKQHAQEDEAAQRSTQEAKETATRKASDHQYKTTPVPEINSTGTKLYCFICKGQGHVARKCPDKPAETPNGVNGTIPSRSEPSLNRNPTVGDFKAKSTTKKGSPVCYTCKKEGHVKRDCPSKAGKGRI